MYFDNTRFKYMCEYITLILDLLYIDKAKSPKIKRNNEKNGPNHINFI